MADTIAETGTIAVIAGGATASLAFTAYTAATTETFVATRCSDNATISSITWSNVDDVVYGTYDSAGNQTGINRLGFNANVTGSVTGGGTYGIAAMMQPSLPWRAIRRSWVRLKPFRVYSHPGQCCGKYRCGNRARYGYRLCCGDAKSHGVCSKLPPRCWRKRTRSLKPCWR